MICPFARIDFPALLSKSMLYTLIIFNLHAAAQNRPATIYVAQQMPGASDKHDAPGTAKHPFKTIASALRVVKPGDRVVIRKGIYRESADLLTSGTKEKPITIEAAKNEQVIMRGSALVKGWTKQTDKNGIYVHENWIKYFGSWKTKPDDARDKARNQIYANGSYIEEVPSIGLLKGNTFYISQNEKKIFLRLKDNADPGSSNIEVSDRDYCLNIRADHIIVRGIRVEYGANGPQGAAMLRMIGNHNLIEDCSVQWAAGSGFTLTGNHNLIRRCVFNYNGQLGFGSGNANYCLFEDCETSYNNLHDGKNYSSGWEAGGNKVAFAKAVNFLRHVAIGNNGPGIWYDISNDSCEVRNCFTQGNNGSGLFYEISYRLHATDNVMIGNGLNSGPESWGANGGITLSSSPGCIVERNILIGNIDGFQFREQGRTTPEISEGSTKRFGKEIPVWNHDQVIRNNILVYNKGAQARGWFDVPDGRHWPAAMRSKLPAKEATSSSEKDWAAGYQAKTSAGQPEDISLEMLNMNIDHNIYWAADSTQATFQWGVTWKYNQKFPNLPALAQTLNFEKNGSVSDPQFRDWQHLDFRVPSNSPLIKNNSYPKGKIPRVRLQRL